MNGRGQMQTVYTTEQPTISRGDSIFLAGPTPRVGSGIPSWRPEAVKILENSGFDGIVFIPESRSGSINWTDEVQVDWEQKCLNMAGCILFWVPRDLTTLPGFTTNIEFGLYLRSGKITFGAPPNAPKTDYMLYCCRKFGIPCADTLEGTINKAVSFLRHKTDTPATGGVNYNFCPYCGRVIGVRIEEEKERKYCRDCKWTYYPAESIAPVAIMERLGKILLVQRNREPHNGKWQLPSGFKDFGETTLEALLRELEEELNVKLVDSEFFEELRSDEDPRNSGSLVPFYIVKWENEPINNERDENAAIGWFNLENLPLIAWKIHLQILRKLKDLL